MPGIVAPSTTVLALVPAAQPRSPGLLENVTVLQVEEGAAVTSVKLVVTAEEAEQLLLAQDLGKFALTLRDPDDVDTLGGPTRTTVSNLLHGGRQSAKSGCRHIDVIRAETK